MADYKGLLAWQRADQVARASFELAARHWSPPNACVYDQLRRAALSVSLNIAEGHAHGPGGRCRSHFRIAYGSAVETVAILEFLAELGTPVDDLPRLARSARGLTYKLWARSRPR